MKTQQKHTFYGRFCVTLYLEVSFESGVFVWLLEISRPLFATVLLLTVIVLLLGCVVYCARHDQCSVLNLQNRMELD